MARVLVAMSGGVDSAVTAYLLKKQGYECVGATMCLYQNGVKGIEFEQKCSSLKDVEDAKRVAEKLGMEHYVFDFSDEFNHDVVQKFIDDYENGWTPNPCVVCNYKLKFGKLLKEAENLNCDYIATGHYARIEKDETGKFVLKKGKSVRKDQSYVLYQFTQETLAKTLFPLGDLDKDEVRKIAEEQGFINAGKKDSQDICFIPDGNYVGFLERSLNKKYESGNIIDTKGEIIGTHRGAVSYTIGQRKGLGVAMPYPIYVVDKDMEKNTVIVGKNEDLFSDGLIAVNWNWINTPINDVVNAMIKIRYAAKEQQCKITQVEEAKVQIIFDEPQRAVAPGQSAVVYDGDKVLGGGIIYSVINKKY